MANKAGHKKPKLPPQTNPFVNSLVLNCFNEVQKNVLYGGGKSISIYPVDKAKYTNVYTDDLFKLFVALPAASKDLFMYVISKIGYEKDTIQIHPETYAEDAGVVIRTFYKARIPLLNVLLIEKPDGTNKDVYWVNPRWVFKGKRTKSYPERIVIHNKAKSIQVATAWAAEDDVNNSEALLSSFENNELQEPVEPYGL